MKFKFIFLFFLTVAVTIAGCMKDSTQGGGPIINPNPIVGNFIGSFELVHLNSKTGRKDTSYASVQIVMGADFSYTLTGDTSAIQQYCNGSFSVDQTNNEMTFIDATKKKYNVNAPKKHLTGTYLYTYNPPNLQIYGSSDTLYYNYTLSK